MDDIRAVVNDEGLMLHINFATDKADLDALIGELGGVRPRPTRTDRVAVCYGNGLTKERAKAILKRHGASFEET